MLEQLLVLEGDLDLITTATEVVESILKPVLLNPALLIMGRGDPNLRNKSFCERIRNQEMLVLPFQLLPNEDLQSEVYIVSSPRGRTRASFCGYAVTLDPNAVIDFDDAELYRHLIEIVALKDYGK